MDARRIADSLNELSRDVRDLTYEVSRHREKLGPQPEWLLFMIPMGAIVVSIACIIIAIARKEPTPSAGKPGIEQQVEAPDPTSE